MTLFVLEQAENEFGKSVSYYESREAGLGIRFRDEVAATVIWIERHPEVPPKGMAATVVSTFAFSLIMSPT